MRRYHALTLTAMLALAACTQNAQSPQPTPAVSIQLDIGVPDNQKEAFVDALRSTVVNGFASSSVSVNVDSYGYGYFQMNQPTTALAGTDLYTSALDDARRKADAVALRLRVSLTAPTSISEELQSFPVGQVQALKGNAQPTTVRILPNQPIVLYVDFATSTPGQSISVFGISSSKTTQPSTGPKLEDVHVMISARGRDVKSAGDAAAKVEAAVRDAATKYGLPASSVQVSGTNFSQP
jgi:uncharacterized protein YggE